MVGNARSIGTNLPIHVDELMVGIIQDSMLWLDMEEKSSPAKEWLEICAETFRYPSLQQAQELPLSTSPLYDRNWS